jgi:predicted MFS family arabinose efflux permease
MMQRRWWIVAILFLLAFITIVDRVCISAAKNDIAAELAISELSFGMAPASISIFAGGASQGVFTINRADEIRKH